MQHHDGHCWSPFSIVRLRVRHSDPGLNQTAFEADQSSASKPILIDLNEINKHGADCINKLLVGNKCELPSKKVVSTGETKDLADSLYIRFLEASAENAHNVEEFFNMVSRGASRQTRKLSRLP